LDGDCEACPMDTYSDVELPDSLTECVDCSSCDVCDTQMGTLETGANSSALCLRKFLYFSISFSRKPKKK